MAASDQPASSNYRDFITLAKRWQGYTEYGPTRTPDKSDIMLYHRPSDNRMVIFVDGDGDGTIQNSEHDYLFERQADGVITVSNYAAKSGNQINYPEKFLRDHAFSEKMKAMGIRHAADGRLTPEEAAEEKTAVIEAFNHKDAKPIIIMVK